MDKLLKISEKYSSNPFFRALVNAIPYFGGSLDVLLSSRWAEYHSKRVDDFMNKVKIELSYLKENQLKNGPIETEGFYDLVYQIAPKVIESRFDQTRTAYAKIIRSALSGDDAIIDLEELVRQISDFKERDYQFLTAIKELSCTCLDITGNSVSRELSAYGYTPIDCERHLYRFEALGLLEHKRNMLQSRGMMPFEILPYFKKVVTFIFT